MHCVMYHASVFMGKFTEAVRCLQVGLEDWEMSRIRVNLLRQAGAHDLLERLSLLSPLPGHSGGNRTSSNFQRMFNKRAARSTPSLQRCALCPFFCVYQCAGFWALDTGRSISQQVH